MELDSKATQAVAVTTGKAVDAAVALGQFVGRVLGTVPQDAVGLLVGDWLHEVRVRNMHRMQQRTEEILSQRPGAQIQAVSPTLALPLFKAAQDESRAELQELWARLLANAMDSNRSGVRRSFIDAIQKIDPMDAIILQKIVASNGLVGRVMHDDWAEEFGVREDEILVSFSHLRSIGCLTEHDQTEYSMDRRAVLHYVYLSSFGRELMRACSL